MLFVSSACFTLMLVGVSLANLTSWLQGRKVGEPVDPEVNMNVTQMIRYHGYSCEDHSVITEDGYILGVQRIPRGRSKQPVSDPNRPVVLLQHGLEMCSACWVENLVNESLGFLMADAGFDVWLGNNRGNFYSSKHTKYNPKQKEFWDFTFDEMIEYDLPATINYILNVTKAQQIYYVGHSQGTLIGFARFGMDKSLGSKVKTFFALAPVTFLDNINSPIKYLAPIANDVQTLFNLLGWYDFEPSESILKWLAQDFCTKEIPDIVCENVIFILGGYDAKQMNVSRVPVYVSHNPSGTSVKNIVHYAQAVLTGKFQKFDYGTPEQNKAHYNQSTPPQYDPALMETPVVLHTGTNDWLADPTDFGRLKPLLKNVVQSKVMQGWEHFDFVWGLDAPQESYQYIIQSIKNQTNMP